MNISTGEVVYTFSPQHRHQEWIQFLGRMEASSPPDQQIHLILDNYSAHKHAKVRPCLSDPSRFHVHYIPTSGPWLNPVERWFGVVSQKCLRCRSAATVAALEQDMAQFLDWRK